MPVNIAIRLDRSSPPEGGIACPDGSEVKFVGWMALLKTLESEIQRADQNEPVSPAQDREEALDDEDRAR